MESPRLQRPRGLSPETNFPSSKSHSTESSPFLTSSTSTSQHSTKHDRWLPVRRRRWIVLLAVVCIVLSAFFIFAVPLLSEDSPKPVCHYPLDLDAAGTSPLSLTAALPPVTVTVTADAVMTATVTVTAPASAATRTVSVSQPQEPVVFSLVMYHESAAIEGAVVIKTAIMYTSRPLEFHIICDEASHAYLKKRLELLVHPIHNILVRFYRMSQKSMADRISREGSIYTDHSAGYPGLMKLFMHEILPDDVRKAIFVDTDAFFLADPALLFDEFKKMNESVAISMPSHPEQGAAWWHYASNICSCIMLLDLGKLREMPLMDSSIYREDTSERRPVAISPPTFEALFGPPGPDGHYRDVALGDQGYWWAIISNRTDLYTPLPHDWEVTSCLLDMYGTGIGNDAATEEEERPLMHNTNGVVHPKLVHFNCLHDIYFEWDGWFDPENSLTQRWGSALDYHAGYKWIWLNRGSGDASLRMETVIDPLFADQKYAVERDRKQEFVVGSLVTDP